jgi:alkyl hydroperoxide reductase subunit F
MLDDSLKAQLQGYLERLQQPVEILASLDESDGSREMLQLLNDIAALSPLVTLEVRRDDAEIKPSFALRRPGEEPRVRFAGVPMGHEFTSLVLALLQVGGHPPKADAETLDQVRILDGRAAIRDVRVLELPELPGRGSGAQSHVGGESAGAPHHDRRRAVSGRGRAARRDGGSRVFLNGEPFGQGRMLLAEILAKLDADAPRREAESAVSDAVDRRAPYDVLVVGGGPAGAAAAVYAARKGIRTGIAAERMGGQLLDTVGIENFISVKETEGHKLAAGLEQHVAATRST